MTDETKDLILERAKREINDLIENELVPATIADFAELHDYCDANEIGGVTEDSFSELFERLQQELDAWIKEGRP